MARKKLPMRQIQEVLRLKHQNQLSLRDIARSCALALSTVGDYLQRAKAASLGWPLPEGMTEEELVRRLFGGAEPPTTASAQPVPDWASVHQELRRKGVTLQLLWREYRQIYPEGYGYSRFCELYQAWAGTLCPVLRQVHLPGEKMFVDWAGQTVPIYHADGTESAAQVFVAVLGFSNKIFAEAFPNQQLASWVTAHCHAYAFYNGVARATVPDNPKTGVTQPCRYEPILHRTYQEMAAHYGTVVLPARPKKPRDKAKVEAGVLIAERDILAVLRDQRFFCVVQLNQAIALLVAQLNDKPFQKLEGTRNTWFEESEKAKLLPLPAHPFELAMWSVAKVNIDYHVVVAHHFYSVPYTLIHQQVDVRLTETTVELFKAGQRIAAHARNDQPGHSTTLEEHRPKSHQKYLQWTPGRMVEWAGTIGPECAKVVERILQDRPHPEMGFRSCLGIIRLGKAVGSARLEAACRRALYFGTCSYTSIHSILKSKLEAQPLEPELPLPSPNHENLRGGPYYN